VRRSLHPLRPNQMILGQPADIRSPWLRHCFARRLHQQLLDRSSTDLGRASKPSTSPAQPPLLATAESGAPAITAEMLDAVSQTNGRSLN
jgi:hypothetical protein